MVIYDKKAKRISITPPTHEKSCRSEAIFLPVRFPRKIARNPQINAKIDVISGLILSKPLLSPIAAESNELARASAAASAAERIFELSKSAAVSSR